MTNRTGWRAKAALACYFALIAGLFLGSLMVALLFYSMGIDYLDSPFPVSLVSTPVNETIILGVTLLFVRYKGTNLKELGLKKPSLRVLVMVSILAVFLFLLGLGISIGEEIVFGSDPVGELFAKAVMPKDIFQLIVLVVFSLVLVGPCEELAFRGFVQKGFENSFGGMKGLLIASVLFGLLHGLNSLFSVIPAFVAGLVLGYVWQRSGGNTTASALMHGINNSISFTITFFLNV